MYYLQDLLAKLQISSAASPLHHRFDMILSQVWSFVKMGSGLWVVMFFVFTLVWGAYVIFIDNSRVWVSDFFLKTPLWVWVYGN